MFQLKADWKSCLRISISLFLLFLCVRYWPIAESSASVVLSAAAPLIIGAVIAYIINILMGFYEKHYPSHKNHVFFQRIRRPLCIIAALITLVAILSVIIVLVAPQLTSCIKLIISLVPQAMNDFVLFLDGLEVVPDDIISVLSSVNWQSKIGQIAEMLTSGLGNVMDVLMTTVTKVFSAIVTSFLSIIFAFYLLMGKDRLKSQMYRVSSHFIPEKPFNKITYALGILNDCFRRYIIGQCTEAVILGVLCTIGMLVLRIPYATMIGALMAVTALIPVAGAYIGAFVGAFMIVTVSPLKAAVFLVFIVVLQQIEGNIIYPKVVGTSLGLPGIWVLAAVTVGGGIMGIAGMLLAVPVAAAVYKMLRNYMLNVDKQNDVVTADAQPIEEQTEN